MSGILGWFSGPQQPTGSNESSTAAPPAQVETPVVHVPKGKGPRKNAKKRELREAKEAERKANEQAKQLQKVEHAEKKRAEELLKKAKKEARIETKELHNKFEILQTPIHHANAQEAQEALRILNDYLINRLGQFVCIGNLEEAKCKTAFNEQSWADFMASFDKFNKEFPDNRKAAQNYAEALKSKREAYVNALIEHKRQKKFEVAQELENYEAIHVPFYNTMLDQEEAIVKQKKTFNDIINGYIAVLDRLEKALHEHYKQNQKELRLLENALNPTRNPLDNVVNLPSGKKDQAPAYTTAVPANTVATDILCSSAMTKKKDAIEFIASCYPRHENEVNIFIGQLIGKVVLRKSVEETQNYNKKNFTKLFDCVSVLGKEAESLIDRLNSFSGQVANNSTQLKPSVIPDKERVVANAQNTKSQYQTLFKEGELVLQKIHARKSELESLKVRFNTKLDNMTTRIVEKQTLLITDFTTIINELSYAMDEIRSNGATFSSWYGAKIAGEQRGFFHPQNNKNKIYVSAAYKEQLSIYREEQQKLEAEKAAKAKEKEEKDKASAAGVGMDEADKKVV